MSAENKMTMTRVIVGVASVGATLALVYLYNKYQDRKGKSGNSSTGTGSRMRRQSANKSGEVKKVTFKTDDEMEGEEGGSKVKGGRSAIASFPGTTASGSSVGVNCKSLLGKEFDKESLAQVVIPPTTAKHEAGGGVEKGNISDGGGVGGRGDANTTNTYEGNSTKLEDSAITTSTPRVEDRVAVEEVMRVGGGSKQHHRPLMTSTPKPGKDTAGQGQGGQGPLRMAAGANATASPIEPHSSDLLKSSAAATASPGDPGSGSGGLQETDYDSHSFRREMKIPREIVPGLIGKKGCNIKGIQAQSNTQINFHDETMENGDRICVIRGAPAQVTLAESLIEKYILEQPIVYTEFVTVPLSSVGRIIGRGGETIRSIQDASKARVNVESNGHYSGADSGNTRKITIKGTEDQIRVAKQLIVEKVEEERTLRKSIDDATASRTHRRPGRVSPASPQVAGPGHNGAPSAANSANSDVVLPVRQDGMLEVFVSCVYHPNDFWIQVVGRDSIELDKLCESMTDHYSTQQNGQVESEFRVGDIVAAPFEVDGKIYRAKIMKIEEKNVEVSYLDYGDRRVLPISEIYELHPNFLQLRYQAIQATLNLGCIGEKWEDDVINVFCDLTYCAQWQALTARVKDYLKDVEDGHDVIWIELLDKQEVNIGDELVRKRLATPKGPSGCNGAQNRKSYAAVALGVSSNVSSTEPVISSADPTLQESLDNDKNGN